MQPVFVLVHSPAVGPSTWRPVAEYLTSAGYHARVPSLLQVGRGEPPYWPRLIGAVREDLAQVPTSTPVTLVAHSNAGVFLPLIAAGLAHRVTASVFVDAALPAVSEATPVAAPEFLGFLQPMVVNGTLPRWTDWWDEADLAPLFPDAATRRTVTEEQPSLPMAYFEQYVPVPVGWDSQRCAYLRFSPPYDALATEARERGWRIAHLPGGHLHQLVDPAGTAQHLVELSTGS